MLPFHGRPPKSIIGHVRLFGHSSLSFFFFFFFIVSKICVHVCVDRLPLSVECNRVSPQSRRDLLPWAYQRFRLWRVASILFSNYTLHDIPSYDPLLTLTCASKACIAKSGLRTSKDHNLLLFQGQFIKRQ